MNGPIRSPFVPIAKSSRRLFLRELNKDDFESWREYMLRSRKSADCGKSAFAKLLKLERRQREEDVRWEVRIFVKDSKKMIGSIDVKTINRQPYQVCDVGYEITPEFRGNGYASEATRALVPLIFKRLGFHRLEFTIDATNKASIQVSKSLGLLEEGLRHYYWPTSYPKSSKIWADQLIFVATPEMWRKSDRTLT